MITDHPAWEIVDSAGWYLVHRGAWPREGWHYLAPDSKDSMPTLTLLNLLRLGGFDARPNKHNPDRIYLRHHEPPSP